MKSPEINSIGKDVIKIESEAVSLMKDRIDKNFERAVNLILNCKGKLVLTGIGKSGLISQKISSTMASTGTPSHFIHPTDAIHGDLGMLKNNDIFLIVSNSGESNELIQIIPVLKKRKIIIVGMIGRKNSTLAKISDIYLDTSVKKEACIIDLAPTASTTATLVLGDALAVTISKLRGFNENDFAELHPGGSLGKRLHLTVDLIKHIKVPLVKKTKNIKETLLVISENGLGVTGVLNDDSVLIGIITDGDIRRGLEKYGDDIFSKTAEFIMSNNPKWIPANTLAIKALEKMEKYSITSLFIYEGKKESVPAGIVHIHDILKLGINY